MKLAPRDINGFLNRPDANAAVIVIYGPEAGLVQERGAQLQTKLLAQPEDPLAVCHFEGRSLADDPATFLDEANAVSLLGPPRRVLRVSDAEDGCTPALKDFTANPNPDVTVIVLAGNLTPRSSLRAWAEKDPRAVALPCYVENQQELQNFVATFLRDNNVSFDAQTAPFLSSQLVGDRLQARRQLEKLITYLGPQKSTLTSDIVRDAIPDLAQQTLDDVVYAAFDAQFAPLFRALDMLFGESVSFMLILRSIQNHARRLEQVHMAMAGGVPFEQASKSLSPPLFFKLEQRFKIQLRTWPEQRLRALQSELMMLEADLKTYSADLTQPLVGQTFLRLFSLPQAA
jgi:DNA polymerase-3 subunit delta